MPKPTIDDVREELGSPSQEDISDATLARLLDEEGTLYGAAYRAALILARKYAFRPDFKRGNYSESTSQISESWSKLAEELKQKAVMSGAMPIMSRQVKKRQPDFWKGMFDYQ